LDKEERILTILMAEAGRGFKRKPRVRRRAVARLLKAWALVCALFWRAYWYVAWHTWLQRSVQRGRRRWQELSGIGKPDSYETFCRPQKIGYICR
jgi:ferric-dicitrate binding protein FerR (iron transport regulator)